jgi:HPt (histidine-containing phosphotransfer) domain-containing protein
MATPLSGVSLDRQVALSRVGGDVQLLKEIAVLFLEDYPKSLTALHEAVAGGDAKAVERAAHSLKGSVANFGAAAAFESARSIEESARAQRLAEVDPMIVRLEQALATLQHELKAL